MKKEIERKYTVNDFPDDLKIKDCANKTSWASFCLNNVGNHKIVLFLCLIRGTSFLCTYKNNYN